LHVLGPAEAIGLVVLPHHVGDDGDHAHVGEAVRQVVERRLHVERVDRRHALAGHAAEQDAVLDVDRGDPAGLEHPHQLGRQEIQLAEEVIVAVGVAEVVVARRILVVVREGDRGDDQVDGVVGHQPRLGDAVVVGHHEAGPGHLDALHAHGARQRLRHADRVEPLFLDDGGHGVPQLDVALPLLHQLAQHLALALGVDDVDLDGVGLLEPLDAVHGLDEVVELEADAEEHGGVAVPLEVAA
jgi:hypothetical protein